MELSQGLFMIYDVNSSENKITLINFIFNRKQEYFGSYDEVFFYEKVFHQALDMNIFLFVEFDESKGIILRD